MTTYTRSAFLALCIILIISMGSVATAAVIRVKPDGDDAKDGSSWQLAKETVAAGLNAAISGDEIWVAAGTYVGCITLKSGVALCGGFAGTETARAQRNWNTNVTVLDGNQGGSVVTSTGATSTTVIDGFTIRNGTGTWVEYEWNSYGGGIYCLSSSPTITNNTITGNSARNGGGISCGSSTVSNNTITGNAASSGGGVYCDSSSATISSNTIARNGGGGIYCPQFKSPTVSCNTIAANSGEGIHCEISSAKISNNIVAFNSSGIAGGGPYGPPVLRNNDVYANTYYNYSGGLSAGTGDISLDPKFASLQYGNFHIQPDSPCRDAGWNDAPGIGTTDMDGQPRIQPTDATVDIGADESDGTLQTVLPVVVRVDGANGNDTNDGSGWGLAKKTVQSAITMASTLGGEVWVKAGVYNERITLQMYAHVYGGFAGTETAREARNWVAANTTVLDGGGGGSVVTSSISGWSAIIDGFTIRNGTGTWIKIQNEWHWYGGGIYCSHSSPTISNNTITGNAASSGGGGVYCGSSDSSATISNNTITRNGSSSGGGIYCSSSSATISNNTITGNAASGGGGGGVYCDSSATISNNTIAGNAASSGGGGGIYCSSSSRMISISNNTITENTASYGGGLVCYSSSIVSNNIVAFNSSGIAGGGGLVLRNNDVYNPRGYNYSGLSAGTGDLSRDPKFAGMQYGNVHIQPDSPCRDAGWNDAPGIGTTDIDGQPRIQPTGGTVDIGADESDGTSWTVLPVVVRVDGADGSDTNDGSSWALGKKTVQSAIDRASALGGEVWVNAGVYSERITLKMYAYVYGGFVGTEAARDARNWVANATVLDGGGGGSVVTVTEGYHCSSIDGFTIRNGRAANGGGILCDSSSPKISNNTITANRGSGIFCDSSSATISDNAITGNGARSGGGIYCGFGSPTISNNTITANSAGSAGGGMYCESSSSPTITNNIVAFNSSGIAGGGGTVLRNNDVYNPGGYDYSGLSAGIGDISLDPELATLDYGNVHIQPGSPCRDAGWNGASGIGTTDIDGQPRIQPAGGTVDIGADESDGTLWEVAPVVVRVDGANGSDVNDGSSWGLAKKTVQSAIDRASLLGGEVWAKAGVYSERITLKDYAYVYGGFAGTETARETRNWMANPTILDGGGGGSVVTASSTGYLLAAVDGFTIRNGGSGIYCSFSSPMVSKNVITGNTSSGISCSSYSSPSISSNIITGNTGSGISCSSYSSPSISSNTITGNTRSGILCMYSSPSISSNTITGNTSSGILCTYSSPTISNSIVAFNSSGIYRSGSSGSPVLRNNDVYANTSYDYSGLSAGTGDISLDPLFVNSTGGDYHLQIVSPCINSGTNSAVGVDWVDVDGEPRIFPSGGNADIGADEYCVHPIWLPGEAKRLVPDGQGVCLVQHGVMVTTAKFADLGAFYVESSNRATGIQCRGTGLLNEGQCAILYGVMATQEGERVLMDAAVVPGTLSTAPIPSPQLIVNKAVGGDAFGLQPGIFDATGLNNIGLLVRTTGKITERDPAIPPTWFKIDDGSGVGVKCVVPSGIEIDPAWGFVGVTGISSCEKVGEELHRLLRVRQQSDIVPF